MALADTSASSDPPELIATEFLPILQDLDAKPKASDAYLWCDYVELRCLNSADHRFSRGNLTELLSEAAAVMDVPQDDQDAEEEELAEIRQENTAVFNADAHEEGPAVVLPSEDLFEKRAGNIFATLSCRADVFGDHYPFVLSADKQELSLRDCNSPTRGLYLQLLISSTLRLVPKNRRHELTEPFEVVADLVFKSLMPTPWEVHRFGAKGATSRFKGKLFDRLSTLACDIHESMKLKAHHFKDGNVGDGGLDLVAWHPLGGDLRVGLPIAFAQCGCAAEEWSLKTLECSPAKLEGHFNGVQHPWATYYFMPQDLYDVSPDGPDWQQRLKLTKSIVIDRLRLLRLADQYGIADQCFGTEEQVFEAITAGVLGA